MKKMNIRATGRRPLQPDVYIKEAIVSDPQQAELDLGCPVSFSVDMRKKTALLGLACNAINLCLRLVFVGLKAMWKVDSLSVDLSRILFNDGDKPIRTDDQLHLSITRANDFLNRLVYPGYENLLMPGLRPDSYSYINGLEIAHQLSDPYGSLMKPFKNARLAGYMTEYRKFDGSKKSGDLQTINVGNHSPSLISCSLKRIELIQWGEPNENGLARRVWMTTQEYGNFLQITIRLKEVKLFDTMTEDSNGRKKGLENNQSNN